MAGNDNQQYIVISESDIDAYIAGLADTGKSHVTTRKYNRVLKKMYRNMPEDKKLYRDTFPKMIPEARKKYSVSTINSAISAYNNLMRYLDHAEYCLEHLEHDKVEMPELTRQEYCNLLVAARNINQRQSYMLVKTFANSNMRVQDLMALTVETVKKGVIEADKDRRVIIPEPLKQELLEYIDEQGYESGWVFRTHTQNTLSRDAICRKIATLGELAGLEPGKANPRSLHKLHNGMMDDIRAKFEPVINSSYNSIMESEEAAVSWDQDF